MRRYITLLTVALFVVSAVSCKGKDDSSKKEEPAKKEVSPSCGALDAAKVTGRLEAVNAPGLDEKLRDVCFATIHDEFFLHMAFTGPAPAEFKAGAVAADSGRYDWVFELFLPKGLEVGQKVKVVKRTSFTPFGTPNVAFVQLEDNRDRADDGSNGRPPELDFHGVGGTIHIVESSDTRTVLDIDVELRPALDPKDAQSPVKQDAEAVRFSARHVKARAKPEPGPEPKPRFQREAP
jgi:hypothetical protein